MNAKEVADLTGVSVRTLHHYDAIGLLTPRRNLENSYREYAGEDLDRLQQILFFKACGFPLDKIAKLLASPDFDYGHALLLQEKALLYERGRIDAMLETLRKTMKAKKGELTMTQKEQFSGFDFRANPYEEEARKRWGDEAVDRSNAALAAMGEEGQKQTAADMDALFASLAPLRGQNPAGEEVQAAMEHMYRYFNDHFGGQYTPEVFAGLGALYVADERFTKNIDHYGEGLSSFLEKAMGIYADGLKA